MKNLSYLKDKDFLRKLDNDNNKFYQVKIEVLNAEEIPIKSIQGRVQTGSSINIDGNSSVRRTCNLTIIAEDAENDLTDVENLLSINKKIKVIEGIENHVDENYDSIIWFPQGIFVIVQPSISHSSNGCLISLSCKDKMCLLNGECGGNLPTSIIFDSYDQIVGKIVCTEDPAKSINNPNNQTIYEQNDGDSKIYKSQTKESGQKLEKTDAAVGTRISVQQRIYNIIQTLVCNYGGEALSKIFINDVPLDIKQIVRQTGSNTLYFNPETGQYTTSEGRVSNDIKSKDKKINNQISFNYNEDIGYIQTDFVYPGSLVSSIGENICSVLDKIKTALGNFEYYYDVEGNFVFQEIKNYLNNSYVPIEEYREEEEKTYTLTLDGINKIEKISVASNGLSILNNVNYEVDFSHGKNVYSFNEGNGLITSYNNNPSYSNLKNDYHVQGKSSDGYVIHYHLVIKEKPRYFNKYNIVYLKNDKNEYTGAIRLASDNEEEGEVIEYTPNDQRAELYLQGLTKQKNQNRADIYEQELLDLFDSIYEFGYYDEAKIQHKEGRFKNGSVSNPNILNYFFDYLEPSYKLADCSVDLIGTKMYSYQQDKIRKLYNTNIPNVILIDIGMDLEAKKELMSRCAREGQSISNVSPEIYSKISLGTIGITAEETMRNLLYQYTNYNESISIQSVPIYYLDTNSRISIYDKKSGIYGDYIIKTINLPLNAENTMSLTAVRALDRL